MIKPAALRLVLGMGGALVLGAACWTGSGDGEPGTGGAGARDAQAGGASGSGGGAEAGKTGSGGSGAGNPSGKIDIVFVVDNSPDSAPLQAKLGQAAGTFLEALVAAAGYFPDLRAAVVTTDLGAGNRPDCPGSAPFGDRGAFKAKAGCGLGAGESFLSVERARNRGNFSGDAGTVLGCLLEVGDRGCGFVQPVLAATIARDVKQNPAHAAFFRDDAVLTFVFVTSDDDCSAREPQTFFGRERPGEHPKLRCAREGHSCANMLVPAADFSIPLDRCAAVSDALVPLVDLDAAVASLIGAHENVGVAVLAGWPGDPGQTPYRIAQGLNGFALGASCTPATGPATPPLRLKGLVERFGPRGRLATVCNDNWSASLASLARLVAR